MFDPVFSITASAERLGDLLLFANTAQKN